MQPSAAPSETVELPMPRLQGDHSKAPADLKPPADEPTGSGTANATEGAAEGVASEIEGTAASGGAVGTAAAAPPPPLPQTSTGGVVRGALAAGCFVARAEAARAQRVLKLEDAIGFVRMVHFEKRNETAVCIAEEELAEELMVGVALAGLEEDKETAAGATEGAAKGAGEEAVEQAGEEAGEEGAAAWVVENIHFGIPLFDVPLCEACCERVRQRALFTPESLTRLAAQQVGCM